MIWLADRIARAVARERVAPVAGPPPGVPAGSVPPDVELRRSRLIPAIGGWLSGMSGPAAAVTIGRTILVHPDVRVGARLLAHELAHVSQWRRQPVTFPFRYIASHIRHGYGGNPFEAEARAAETGAGKGSAEPDIERPGARP